MQINIRKNNILVKLLETEEELEKARRLRYEELILFHRDRDDISYEESYNDVDRFCDNLIAIDTDTNEVVGSYRLINKEHLDKTGGFACDATFDVTAIKNSPEKAVELGRAVVKEEYRDGIVIKCLLQGLFRYLLEYGAKYTFGIIYLPKMDEKAFDNLVSYFYTRLLDKNELDIKAREPSFSLNRKPKQEIDLALVKKHIPPLVKAYLMLGCRFAGTGCVSDKLFDSPGVMLVVDKDNIDDRLVKYIIGK